jgi:hypothetical protein
MTVREFWFQRLESTHRRTGFRMTVSSHAAFCLCTTCFADLLDWQEGVER